MHIRTPSSEFDFIFFYDVEISRISYNCVISRERTYTYFYTYMHTHIYIHHRKEMSDASCFQKRGFPLFALLAKRLGDDAGLAAGVVLLAVVLHPGVATQPALAVLRRG